MISNIFVLLLTISIDIYFAVYRRLRNVSVGMRKYLETYMYTYIYYPLNSLQAPAFSKVMDYAMYVSKADLRCSREARCHLICTYFANHDSCKDIAPENLSQNHGITLLQSALVIAMGAK